MGATQPLCQGSSSSSSRLPAPGLEQPAGWAVSLLKAKSIPRLLPARLRGLLTQESEGTFLFQPLLSSLAELENK